MNAHGPTARLTLTAAQTDAVEATLEAVTRACDDAMAVGRAAATTSNARIHHLCYHDLRRRFGLSANLTIRVIARAAGLLKDGRASVPRDERDRIDFDMRVFSYDVGAMAISLSTIAGRLRGIPLRAEATLHAAIARGGLLRIVLIRAAPGEYDLHFHFADRQPEREAGIADGPTASQSAST